MPTPPQPSGARVLARRPVLVVLVLVVLGVAVLALASGVLPFGDDGDARNGEAAVATLEDGVVATVDGEPVTELQWEIALFAAGSAQEHLDEAQLDEYPEDMRHFITAHVEVSQRYPQEAVAFAGLLVNHAVLAEATASGLAIDEAALAAFVEEQRHVAQLMREGDLSADPASVEQLEGTLAIAGEERYWNELTPHWGRLAQAREHLLEQRGGRTEPDWGARWDAHQQELARTAEVTLTSTLAERVSLPEVRTYLDEIAAIEPLP